MSRKSVIFWRNKNERSREDPLLSSLSWWEIVKIIPDNTILPSEYSLWNIDRIFEIILKINLEESLQELGLFVMQWESHQKIYLFWLNSMLHFSVRFIHASMYFLHDLGFWSIHRKQSPQFLLLCKWRASRLESMSSWMPGLFQSSAMWMCFLDTVKVHFYSI